MIILPNSRLKLKAGCADIYTIESSDLVSVCPVCGKATLKLRDHTIRIMKWQGGTITWVEIPRFRCSENHPKRYHNGLPEQSSPFKHYRTDIIQDAADDLLTVDDLEKEDFEYPSESTLKRWKDWVERNVLNIDGHLKSVGSRLEDFGEGLLWAGESLLEALRVYGFDWLAIVQRIIYNSGGFLPR